MRLMRYASERGESTIYNHLKTGRASAYRLEEIMERTIYALAKEKADLQQMLIDAANGVTHDSPTKSV